MFLEHTGKTALQLIMEHCSQSEGIFKCLDNCLKTSLNNGDNTNQTPNWEIDFSFLLKCHLISDREKEVTKERRRDSINLVGKELALRKKWSEKSLLMNVRKMETDSIRSGTRESAKAFMMHPVTQMYVEKRWQEVKWMYYLMVLGWHIFYALVFTLYSTLTFNYLCPLTEGENDSNWYSSVSMNMMDSNWLNNFNKTINCNMTGTDPKTFSSQANFSIFAWITLIIYTFMVALEVMLNVCSRGIKTFRRYGTFFDVAVIVNFAMCSWHTNPFDGTVSMQKYQYHAAVWGTFWSWIGVCYYMEKLPEMGLYLVMLRQVAKTAIGVCSAFSTLLLAFFFTFNLVFPWAPAFGNDITGSVAKV